MVIASGQGTMYVEYKGLMTNTVECFTHLEEQNVYRRKIPLDFMQWSETSTYPMIILCIKQ